MGRDMISGVQSPELTGDIETNAIELLRRVNLLLSMFYAAHPDAERPAVNSGWRPPSVNARTPNAAKRSKHMTGRAIDLSDDEGALDDWCMDNLDKLDAAGLWLEHPAATKNWCHLQSVPPRSGSRVFYP